MFRFIYGLLGGPEEEVEDLTMKTFLKAWRSRSSFTGNEEAAFGWLLKIARNLVIDHQRSIGSREVHFDIETQAIPTPGLTPEEMVHQKEQIQILWRVLRTLPRHQGEMIVLRYILGWRVKDIGEYLEVSENTVSVSLRRILKRIRSRWSEYE